MQNEVHPGHDLHDTREFKLNYLVIIIMWTSLGFDSWELTLAKLAMDLCLWCLLSMVKGPRTQNEIYLLNTQQFMWKANSYRKLEKYMKSYS